jgi:hypothetical protein
MGGDSVAVDDDGAARELAEVVPIEVPAIPEFPHQAGRIEAIACLPELLFSELSGALFQNYLA